MGEPLEAMMGRSGASGLWIFGCPKNLGQMKLEGLSLRYRGKGRASALCRARSLLVTLFSMEGIGFLGERAVRTRSKNAAHLISVVVCSVHDDSGVSFICLQDVDGASRRRTRRAASSDLVRLGLGGRALRMISWICTRTSIAEDLGRCLMAGSVA